MLVLTNHSIYRYAKRVFYQDVDDKRNNLAPKQYTMVKAHARNAIAGMVDVGNGKYPVPNTPLIAVVEDGHIKTFLYKASQIEQDYI